MFRVLELKDDKLVLEWSFETPDKLTKNDMLGFMKVSKGFDVMLVGKGMGFNLKKEGRKLIITVVVK
mgnify:CR=1 FL=1